MKVLTALLLLAGLLSSMSVQAVPVAEKPAAVKAGAVAAPVKVTSVEGITEYRLANGLRVLLFPDASKPVLTTNIVYQVGSRHENYGETGMAHLLEHLLFKPSLNYGVKKGTPTPVELMNKIGADWNGTTWYDRTNYFASFPASDENLETMLKLEADRMLHAAIDQKDLWDPVAKKGEMTVVRNEFEMGENDPFRVTLQRVQSVAFDWHNYGKSTIGARSDIENVNIEHLRAFYHQYYQPDNAVLIVAGKMDEAKALDKINAILGKLPKPARVLSPTYTKEPVQDGERQVTVRRVGGVQLVLAGYHVPPASHADDTAFGMAATALADAPGGRLYKALVDTKLATEVFAYGNDYLEPGFFLFGAVLPKDGDTEAAQAAMLKVLENVKSAPLTAQELDRVKTQVRKHMDLTLSDTKRLSIALTEYLAAGDWRLMFKGRDEAEAMDLKSAQAAAEKYLKPSNRTVARFIPTDAPDRTEVPAAPDIAAMLKDYKGHALVSQGEVFDPSPANIDKRIQHFTLPIGLKAAVVPKKTKGETVNLVLQLRMGTEATLTNKAFAGRYAEALLMRGTETKSRQEIKDAFDKLSAQVTITGGLEAVTVSVKTTRANLPATLELVAEVLRKPAFSEKEFADLQREFVVNAEQEVPEPNDQAFNAMRRLIDATPVGHPRHVETLANIVALHKAQKLEDVKAFHHAFYGAQDALLTAVGEVDPAALQAQVGKLFGDWKASEAYVRIPNTVRQVSGEKQVLETPDKSNSMLVAVQPMRLRDDAPQYAALVLANHMLGGGQIRSRLADRIRQKEGLSYGVGSFMNVTARDEYSVWNAYAISAPENAAKVEAALRDEVARALKDGFTDQELADAKSGWLKTREVNRAEDASLARHLNSELDLGRSMAFDAALEAKVKALSKDEVNAALRAFIKPEAISIVMAGDFAKAAKAAPAK